MMEGPYGGPDVGWGAGGVGVSAMRMHGMRGGEMHHKKH